MLRDVMKIALKEYKDKACLVSSIARNPRKNWAADREDFAYDTENMAS